ncbi:MAG: PadR family transcriptional regulator [Bacteroidota bacterium]
MNRSPTPVASNEIALLGFLLDGPRHGYAMYKELTQTSDLWLVWRMKQSQFYALLARLASHGLLTSFKGEAEPGRPPRKMYQLTDAGRAAFEDWLKAPVQRGRQFRLDLLVKLFFAQKQGAQGVSTLLNMQQKTCNRWLQECTHAARDAAQPYQRLVHKYRTGQIEAMLLWIDACREELVSAASINPAHS